jgi:hypothetical protein
MGLNLADQTIGSPASHWFLAPATTARIEAWSYGAVDDIDDLYDARTFGPTKDRSCECGKHRGRQACGTVCDECGVLVTEESAHLRKLRLGHIRLPLACPHPFDRERLIFAWPVAPTAYRRSADGTPTDIGLKYERLVSVIREIAEKLPPKGTDDYYKAVMRSDCGPISLAIDDILGPRSIDALKGQSPGLVSALLETLIGLDRCASALAQACGLALRVEATF